MCIDGAGCRRYPQYAGFVAYWSRQMRQARAPGSANLPMRPSELLPNLDTDQRVQCLQSYGVSGRTAMIDDDGCNRSNLRGCRRNPFAGWGHTALTNVRRRVRGRIIPLIGAAAVLPTIRSTAGIAVRRFRPTAIIRHGGARDCLGHCSFVMLITITVLGSDRRPEPGRSRSRTTDQRLPPPMPPRPVGARYRSELMTAS